MKYALLAVLSLGSFSTFSQNHLPHQLPRGGQGQIVYGTDDRKDVREVTNPLYLRLAESTAAMFPNAALSPDGLDHYILNFGTLETEVQVCTEEKFSQQLAGALCSGFLVGPDLLITAGHCVENQESCNSNKWVFDYHDHLANLSNKVIKAENVYRCKSVVSRSLDQVTMLDYALIKLDRVAVGRVPLKYRTEGKIADNASLVVIGHPSGLPTKIADKANVRMNTNPVYFRSNLDTFGGNSGAAVFDANTGIVEGILVRGDEDYKVDLARSCRKVNYASVDGGRGEDVTRITNVFGLAGVKASPPPVAPVVDITSVLGLWKRSVNDNLTLKFEILNGKPIATTTGFAGVGVKFVSDVSIDLDKDLAIDFMPSKTCKMFLRPAGATKIYYAYCGKRFTADAYFTR